MALGAITRSMVTLRVGSSAAAAMPRRSSSRARDEQSAARALGKARLRRAKKQRWPGSREEGAAELLPGAAAAPSWYSWRWIYGCGWVGQAGGQDAEWGWDCTWEE